MEFSLRLRDAPARRRHKTEEKFPVFNVCFGLFRYSSDGHQTISANNLGSGSKRLREDSESTKKIDRRRCRHTKLATTTWPRGDLFRRRWNVVRIFMVICGARKFIHKTLETTTTREKRREKIHQ